MTKDCNLLGIFCFEGITPAPIGVPKLEVCFSADADGMFEVTCCNKLYDKKKTQIFSIKGRLKRSDFERMIEEAENIKCSMIIHKNHIN